MISAKQYTNTYERYTEMLLRDAERIERSSETRKYLMKRSADAPLEELLLEAVECISELTGDLILPKQVKRNLERRKQ